MKRRKNESMRLVVEYVETTPEKWRDAISA